MFLIPCLINAASLPWGAPHSPAWPFRRRLDVAPVTIAPTNIHYVSPPIRALCNTVTTDIMAAYCF